MRLAVGPIFKAILRSPDIDCNSNAMVNNNSCMKALHTLEMMIANTAALVYAKSSYHNIQMRVHVSALDISHMCIHNSTYIFTPRLGGAPGAQERQRLMASPKPSKT